MTNGDRIRQMTDEELADNLLLSHNMFTCRVCPYITCCKGKTCTDGANEWLRQEAKDDD